MNLVDLLEIKETVTDEDENWLEVYYLLKI